MYIEPRTYQESINVINTLVAHQNRILSEYSKGLPKSPLDVLTEQQQNLLIVYRSQCENAKRLQDLLSKTAESLNLIISFHEDALNQQAPGASNGDAGGGEGALDSRRDGALQSERGGDGVRASRSHKPTNFFGVLSKKNMVVFLENVLTCLKYASAALIISIVFFAVYAIIDGSPTTQCPPQVYVTLENFTATDDTPFCGPCPQPLCPPYPYHTPYIPHPPQTQPFKSLSTPSLFDFDPHPAVLHDGNKTCLTLDELHAVRLESYTDGYEICRVEGAQQLSHLFEKAEKENKARRASRGTMNWVSVKRLFPW